MLPIERLRRQRERGFSLLELVASIVLLGLVVAGFVSAFSTVMRHASDGALQSQAGAVAAAYLDEILTRPFRDPDSGSLCAAPEANRPAFDNVCDYDQLAFNGCTATTTACQTLGACACDVNGAPVDGLRAFDVSVSVTPQTLAGVGGLRVSVGVSHEALGGAVTLEAFRAED